MLKIENLTHKIINNGEEKVIFDNLNLEFKKGKNYIITGANGCGKSTLAKIIMGIIPIQSGKITFNGVDISNLNITERAKMGMAFAMQQPIKFKGIKAKDILNFATNTKLNTSSACEYLSKVGLCARDYLDRELDSTLSGGELKRIEIAGVLARQCNLNIFDEPEAGIDIWSFNSLVDIFKKNSSQEKTNIIISHQERLFSSADEILLLDNGKIVLSGKPKDVMPHLKNFGTCKKIEEANNG